MSSSPSGDETTQSPGGRTVTLADNQVEDPPELDASDGVTRLGHHLLLGMLGRGGMGVVYAAYDAKLDRKVAIKLLRSRGNEEAQRRMLREAQAMARISHPNVVQVYEIGEHDQQTFVVMEFVDGVTLKTWLQQRPRSLREILATFTAAGHGLAAAHEKGLVHRDFKPDNVMIRRDGRVLVMDFGLAHGHERGSSSETGATAVERTSELEQSLTQGDVIMGTPAYMAPEQFEGRETDARTDQFSFCVALWEALFEQRPFRGSNFQDLSLAVSEGRLIVPERSEVPAWLRSVLECGLKRDPDRRWPTMLALLEALGRDPTRRRRAYMLSAGVLALLGAGMGSGLAWRAHARQTTIAECERAGQAIDADWNEDVASTLARAFESTGATFAPSVWTHTLPWVDDYAHEWATLRTRTCVETHVEHTRDQASHDAIVSCLDARRAGFAGLLGAWAEPDKQTVVAATQAAANLVPLSTCTSEELAARAQPPEPLAAEVARVREQIEGVEASKLAGDYDEGLVRALELRETADELGWRPLQAEAMLLVGSLQASLGKYADARASHEQAFFHATAGGDDTTMLLAATQLTFEVGYHLALHEQGRMWGTLGEMLIERLGLAGTLREAAVIGAVAGVANVRGEYDEALVQFRRALAIKQAILGPDHPGVANSLNSIGVVLFHQKQGDAAIEHFRRSLSIEEAALGPEHPGVADSLNNLGAALQQLGRNDEALEYNQRALAIRKAAFGPDSPDVAASLGNIGTLLAAKGQFEQALELERRALEIFEAALGPRHPDVALTHEAIAEIFVAQGEYASALEHYRRTLAIREATLAPEHPDVVSSRRDIAAIEAKLATSPSE